MRKYELHLLLRQLTERDPRDVRFIRSCLYEILMFSTAGCDVSPALPTVVKLLASPDAFVKRVAGEIMSVYGEDNTEMALLATNTLVQDCTDVNPVVRGLGLRGLASLQSYTSVDNLSAAIVAGMGDSSSYVRKSAALAAVRLHELSPTSVTETEIWDLLYRNLSDTDPPIVAACLCAIEEIFAKEKGIVISNKLGQYLINTMPSYPPAVQRVVLQFLLKYSPKVKSKVFDHLNTLDDCLTKTDSLALTLCSLEAFCHLTSTLPKVRLKVYPTAWTAIMNNLTKERNEELTAATIDYLTLTDFPTNACEQDYRKFFCKDDDHQFGISKKICYLSRLMNPQNADQILNEFLSCARRVSPDIVKEMVKSVARRMAVELEVETACVDFLIKLMKMDCVRVFDSVVQVLASATLTAETSWQALMMSVCDNYHLLESMEGKVALLQILGLHCSLVKDPALDILKAFMKEVEENCSDCDHQNPSQMVAERDSVNLFDNQLKLSLLGAMVSLCMERQAIVQPMLSRLMEMCLSDPERCVRDRAKFLYGLLLAKAQEKTAVEYTYTVI